jgi:hypothetical protein
LQKIPSKVRKKIERFADQYGGLDQLGVAIKEEKSRQSQPAGKFWTAGGKIFSFNALGLHFFACNRQTR